MRSYIHAAAGISFALLILGCNSSTPDSVREAKKENNAAADSEQKKELPTDSLRTPSKQDADFAVNAAGGGMLEVKLGQLAQTNAHDQGVKDFGSMMIRDHTRAGDMLKGLAYVKHVVLPADISNDHQKILEELQKKKGAAFDKAYIDYMVDDHKEDIDEFEKEGKNGSDRDIKDFSSQHLPVLHQHLDSAQNLQRKLKKY